MPELTNPYDAVIADLEAKRAEIDSALQLMKRLRDFAGAATMLASPPSNRPSAPIADLTDIPSDAFFNMTIADAAVKFLAAWASRKPQNTHTIIEALAHGGLKNKAYPSVYGNLHRRAAKVGDVVNVHGDWALAEWYETARAKKQRQPKKWETSEGTRRAEEESKSAIEELTAGMEIQK